MIYPKATLSNLGPLPLSNYAPDSMGEVLGICLHIMQGTLSGTDSWFHNSAAQVSAHFGNGKDGTLIQWLDTDHMSYAQVDGNPNYISIEHEGNSGDLLTAAQIQNDISILAWLKSNYPSVCLDFCDTPGSCGVAGHVTGGASWGGHLDCPGVSIMGQRSLIINGAIALQNSSPTSGNILEVLMGSLVDNEFAVRYLARICLRREIDVGGFTTFVAILNNGGTLNDVMTNMQDSPEGQAVIAAERKLLGLT